MISCRRFSVSESVCRNSAPTCELQSASSSPASSSLSTHWRGTHDTTPCWPIGVLTASNDGLLLPRLYSKNQHLVKMFKKNSIDCTKMKTEKNYLDDRLELELAVKLVLLIPKSTCWSSLLRKEYKNLSKIIHRENPIDLKMIQRKKEKKTFCIFLCEQPFDPNE